MDYVLMALLVVWTLGWVVVIAYGLWLLLRRLTDGPTYHDIPGDYDY